MKILVTNDDGIRAKGLSVLVELLKPYAEITVVAPKETQSGMSMAIPLGLDKHITASKAEIREGVRWQWVDSTPDACVKFALGDAFRGYKPDLIVSGINHGSNAATAACYSGTLGAAAEGAINGIRAIGVSLDTWRCDPDFSAVQKIFPDIFQKLLQRCRSLDPLSGIYYNVNFPYLPADKIKGISVCSMGLVHWADEYVANPDGTYHIEGHLDDYPVNAPDADHKRLSQGWITIVPHRIDTTDYGEREELLKLFR